MAITKVQDTVRQAGTGSSTTAAYATNVTHNNLLVVMFFMNSAAGADTFTISDTGFQNLTWTSLFSAQYNSSIQQTVQAWAAYAGSTAGETLSFTWTHTDANGGDIVLTEWSGLTGPVALDGSAAIATSTANPVVTPTYTPGVTGDLVINMVATSNIITAFGGSAPAWTTGDVGGTGHLNATGGGWAWTTGATSLLTPNATQGSGTADSIVFGIKASGAATAHSLIVPNRNQRNTLIRM